MRLTHLLLLGADTQLCVQAEIVPIYIYIALDAVATTFSPFVCAINIYLVCTRYCTRKSIDTVDRMKTFNGDEKKT